MHPSVATSSLGLKGRLTRLIEDRRNPEPLGPESDNFSMEELVSSLKASKALGAKGLGGLAPRFLKNLGKVSRSFMLDTFNKSWREGNLPTILEGCGNCSHLQARQTRGSARLLSNFICNTKSH
jgi:hypothetical protein